MTKQADAIVIGAGHNGLVCAAYLARAGLQVQVVEAAPHTGGMSAPHVVGNGYESPGLAHLVYPLSDRIRRDLRLDEFGYEPGPAVDTIALSESGTHLTIGRNSISGNGLDDNDRQAFAAFKDRYLKFAKSIRPLFENKPPRLKNAEFADVKTLAKLGWNLRMGLGRESMNEFLRVAAINIFDVLNEAFDNEALKGAVAADAVLGSAMGPRTPGTVLTWLQRLHAELNGDLCLQTGTESGAIRALTRCAEDAGVTFRYGVRVKSIAIENDRAVGVRLADGGSLAGQLVVSGTDPRSTITSLVGAPNLDAMFAQRASQIRGSGVVAKMYLTLDAIPEFKGLSPEQTAQRLLLAPSMKYVEHAFNASKYGELPDEPVLEITVPTIHNNALAPKGHHLLSINVSYVPYRLRDGWSGCRQAFTDRVVSVIGRFAPGLSAAVTGAELLTPQDIEHQYHAIHGHWHHGELTLHQSFMMRPLHGAAQYDTPIENLFLCSAGCHPGGGITGWPGRNAAERILDLGAGQ